MNFLQFKKSENKDDIQLTETKTESKKTFVFNKKMLYIILPIFAVLVFLISSILWAYSVCKLPVTAELGTLPDYSQYEKNIFLSIYTEIDTDISQLDNTKTGKNSVDITLLGFIKTKSELEFIDTVPPKAVSRDVCISVGVTPTPDMFVSNIDEITKTEISFTNPSFNQNKAGNYEINLTAKDENNNTTNFKANLSVIDTASVLFFKNGTNIPTVKNKIEKEFKGIKSLDFSNQKQHGEFLVNGFIEDTLYILKVSIDDIVPPKATVKSYDILLGTKLEDSDIIFDIVDFSDVDITFSNKPDFSKSGEYVLQITIVDSYNNKNTYTSTIRIHDINTKIKYELGSGLYTFSNLIFNDNYSTKCLKIEKTPEEIGQQKIKLKGKYNSFDILVDTIDTTPPKLITKNVSKILNSKVSVNDFIQLCTDALPITYTLKGKYKTDSEGAYNLTVKATDSVGNITESNVELIIFVDKIPPVISGIKELVYVIGEEKPDFLYGITAFDETDGKLEVSVDTTAVDLKKENTYKIHYTATDKSGNKATQSSTIKVKLPTKVKLNVSNIMQLPMLPNGCEVVSLAIALKYAGYSIDPVELYYDYMPKTPLQEGDPWTHYMGDATGLGYGCYAPCVVETGNFYLQEKGSTKAVYDVSGQETAEYEKYIDDGIPVIFWGLIQMNGEEKLAWAGYANGRYVDWHSFSHCLVLIGYTDHTYIFCDPLRGVVEYPREDVVKSFEINYRQACIIKDKE